MEEDRRNEDPIREHLSVIFGQERIDRIYSKTNTRALSSSTPKDLKAIGVPPRMAENLHAIFKIRHAPYAELGVQLTQSSDVYDVVKDIGQLDHEIFILLIVDQSNRVTHRLVHSRGGPAGTVVDCQRLLKQAVNHKARALILVHNHPSGNLTPSKADIEITKKIKQSCKTIDIALLDHVIVGAENGFVSMADEGLM